MAHFEIFLRKHHVPRCQHCSLQYSLLISGSDGTSTSHITSLASKHFYCIGNKISTWKVFMGYIRPLSTFPCFRDLIMGTYFSKATGKNEVLFCHLNLICEARAFSIQSAPLKRIIKYILHPMLSLVIDTV